MNYDEIALNLINDWETSSFKTECQMKADLQCRIIDALKAAAFSDSSPSAGWVCSKVKDELTQLMHYIGITPKSLLSDRQDMMKRVDRILTHFEDKPNR